jgi:YggT family protein
MAGFLVQFINLFVSFYSLIIIARVFLPLVGADPQNPIIRFIFDVTEPVLAPLRRYTVVGMWDLSPVVVLVLLTVVQQVVVTLVLGLLR